LGTAFFAVFAASREAKVAMSSSPWERLRNGDEDVATPFHGVAVLRRAAG
jgi:hypothetical protein